MSSEFGPIISILHSLVEVNNSHNSGVKRVFVNQQQVNSALTQFAHGKLTTGQQSGFHSHATMDEYFYFMSGKGIYTINNIDYDTVPETFIRVPAGLSHNLKNHAEQPLEFVYFGIAL